MAALLKSQQNKMEEGEEFGEPAVVQVCGGDGGEPGEDGASADSDKGTKTPPPCANGLSRDAKVCVLKVENNCRPHMQYTVIV